ncbi:MAG: hypothetical protein KDC98_04850 [Planctomycetes bacterium]|nr:hypothetical protein [Planctomycetota bacterium]
MKTLLTSIWIAFAAPTLLAQGSITASLPKSRILQFEPVFVAVEVASASKEAAAVTINWLDLRVERVGAADGQSIAASIGRESAGLAKMSVAAGAPVVLERMLFSPEFTQDPGRYRLRVAARFSSGKDADRQVVSPWVAYEVVPSRSGAGALRAEGPARQAYAALLAGGVSRDGRVLTGLSDAELADLQDAIGQGDIWALAALARCELAIRELGTCYDRARRQQLGARIESLMASLAPAEYDGSTGGLAAHALYLRARLGWLGLPCPGTSGDRAFAQLRTRFPDSMRAYRRFDGRQFGNLDGAR